MATAATTQKRTQHRRPGRPRIHPIDSEPPLKKLRYVPGGPGGGGRYINDGSRDSLSYSGSRTRSARHESRQRTSLVARSPVTPYGRPRTGQPEPTPRYSSAAAAATAMTQSEGYKPREERGWEEFHPDLDLDVELPVFGADEVDGRFSGGATPRSGLSAPPKSMNDIGAAAVVDNALLAQQATQVGIPHALHEVEIPAILTPIKRRVGRPPRRQESMLNGLGSPPTPRIIPLPTHNPKERLNLPKPSFRRVEIFEAFEQDKSVGLNYVDKSLSNVGYQETDRFIRPDKMYIRCQDGVVEDDAEGLVQHGTDEIGHMKVEYDMDEQDERWLEGINAERKSEGVEAIRPAIFEITITAIEKEWYALEKRIPKPNPKPPQTQRPRSGSSAAVNGEPVAAGEEQDTKCAVCDDGDCENTNAIVFCDGCDLAVHQECYGVPFIPEGQWLCRKCQLLGRNSPTCIFCPNVDGAFKQTNTLRWSHLLCAIWIPEVSLGNTTFMEPVMEVEKVPKQRWKLHCYICQQRMGACIQCSNKNCFVAFHVTCARRAHLFLKMKSPHGGINDSNYLKGFCDKHVPSEWRREHRTDIATAEAKDYYRRTMRGRRWADSQQSALAPPGPLTSGYIEEEGEHEDALANVGNKRKRQELQKIIWRLPSGAPIIPQAVYHNVEKILIRFNIRKRKDYVAEACKYWSLKREARRGASLLKRLQLQMETFTSMELTRRNFAGMGAAGRPRLQRRIEFAEGLEDDMESVRVLSEMVRQRSQAKLHDLDILHDLVDIIYFPIIPLIAPALEKAQTLDANVKNYYKQGLDAVRKRLEARVILSVAQFAKELAKAFSAWQDIDPPVDGPADEILVKEIIHEQRERRNRAKRILDEIKKQFLRDAVRKETDISGKSYEDEWANVERILDEPFRHPLGLARIKDGPPKGTNVEEDVKSHPESTKELTNGHKVESVNGVKGVDTDGDIVMAEDDPSHQLTNGVEPELDPEASVPHSQLQDGPADEAIIKLKAPNGTIISIGNKDGNLPALSISDHGEGSTTNQTVTSSLSGNDINLLDGGGGIPSYLEDFEPDGTAIVEPPSWKGRDALMSEELSELDDDALNDLVNEDLPPIPTTDGGTGDQSLRVHAIKKKNVKKRKKFW